MSPVLVQPDPPANHHTTEPEPTPARSRANHHTTEPEPPGPLPVPNGSVRRWLSAPLAGPRGRRQPSRRPAGRTRLYCPFGEGKSGIFSNVAAPPHMVPYVIGMGKDAHATLYGPKASCIG